MIPRGLHSWSVTPRQAVSLQRKLAPRVLRVGTVPEPRWFAGADAAFSSDGTECIAGVVLWERTSSRILERHVVRAPLRFPYVPGLLSFREAPAILKAFRELRREPHVVILDGQGYAHPRRFGLACHVGLWLDLPTIGCAKSRLIGDHGTLAERKTSIVGLYHGAERIGTVVRTRDGVKPIYVSIGHRVSLEEAVRLTLACCTRYRVPEPTRLADQLVTRAKSNNPGH